jgi:hypothetical protein
METKGSVAFLDAKTENGLSSFCQIILYPSVRVWEKQIKILNGLG